MDESQFPEFVHKEIHAAPRCPNQFSQSLLRYFGHYGFWLACFSVTGKYQKSASQPLFARIEQLVHQVGLSLQVALQHISDELSRNDQLRLAFMTGDAGLPRFWQPRFHDFNVYSRYKLKAGVHA
jgi:hypothetical protein